MQQLLGGNKKSACDSALFANRQGPIAYGNRCRCYAAFALCMLLMCRHVTAAVSCMEFEKPQSMLTPSVQASASGPRMTAQGNCKLTLRALAHKGLPGARQLVGHSDMPYGDD